MSRPYGPLEPKTINVDVIAAPKGIGGMHCQTCPHSKSSKVKWPCVDCLQGDRKPSQPDPHSQQIADLQAEVERLRARLVISPYGDDKIDELESSANFLRHRAESFESELAITQKLREMDREQVKNMVRLVAEKEAKLSDERKAHAELKAKMENAPVIKMHVIDGHTVSHYCHSNVLDLEEGGSCKVALVKLEENKCLKT